MSEIKHPENLDKTDAYFLFGYFSGVRQRLKVIHRAVKEGDVCSEVEDLIQDIVRMQTRLSERGEKDGKKSKV